MAVRHINGVDGMEAVSVPKDAPWFRISGVGARFYLILYLPEVKSEAKSIINISCLQWYSTSTRTVRY